jgi:hypothetical protein
MVMTAEASDPRGQQMRGNKAGGSDDHLQGRFENMTSYLFDERPRG